MKVSSWNNATIGAQIASYSPVFSIKVLRSRVASKRVAQRASTKLNISDILAAKWHALIVPTRHCVECLADIPKTAERCPHCRALQQSEELRSRERNEGWL